MIQFAVIISYYIFKLYIHCDGVKMSISPFEGEKLIRLKVRQTLAMCSL